MSSKAARLDWIDRASAKYACENFHYSRSLPAGKLMTVGVWEFNNFIGCVIFGRGANNNIGKKYNLQQTEICELVRVALSDHKTPVSRIVSIAIKMISKAAPGLKLIISYADPMQGHHGGIYQAMNWICTGQTRGDKAVILNGKLTHKRSISSKYGTLSFDKIREITGKSCEYGPIQYKITYLFALDDETAQMINDLKKPYISKEAAQALHN